MSPLEQKVAELERMVEILRAGQDTAFIEAIKRYIEVPTNLNDLSDVDTTGVSNGEVIKYNSSNSKWEPGPDIDT